MGGQLADGGGLSHPVDADEQNHRGLAAHVHVGAPQVQVLRQDLPHTLPGALGVLDPLVLAARPQLVHRLHSGLRAQVGHHQGFLQLLIKVLGELGKAVENADLFDLIKKAHECLLTNC